MHKETVEAVLKENTALAENAVLNQQIKEMSQRTPLLTMKNHSSLETYKHSRIVNESSREISDMTDSRLNLVKGFDSMGNKTGADISCEEQLTEVA